MDYWKKQNIDNCIIELEKYYNDCSANYFNGQGVLDKLNKEETIYLNENLNLSKIVGVDSNVILNETLKHKEKDNFSTLILRTKIIDVEVNYADDSGKTIFMLLVEKYFSEKDGYLQYNISQLFDRNYVIKNEDVVFVNELYKKIQSQSQFENWSLLRFAVKLKDNQKIALAFQKQRELFVILSLKLNRPIHFNFPNLLGILNNAIQHYRESGEIILKAINHYDRSNQIKELDLRKGIFKNKLSEFEVNKPIQDKEFEELVIDLFPELK